MERITTGDVLAGILFGGILSGVLPALACEAALRLLAFLGV